MFCPKHFSHCQKDFLTTLRLHEDNTRRTTHATYTSLKWTEIIRSYFQNICLIQLTFISKRVQTFMPSFGSYSYREVLQYFNLRYEESFKFEANVQLPEQIVASTASYHREYLKQFLRPWAELKISITLQTLTFY